MSALTEEQVVQDTKAENEEEVEDEGDEPSDTSVQVQYDLVLLPTIRTPSQITTFEQGWRAHSDSTTSAIAEPLDPVTKGYSERYRISLEFNTQKDRITRIIDQAINCTEIAMCIPLLAQNEGVLLRPVCNREEMELLMSCCNKYHGYDMMFNKGLHNDIPRSISKIFEGDIESIIQMVTDNDTTKTDLNKEGASKECCEHQSKSSVTWASDQDISKPKSKNMKVSASKTGVASKAKRLDPMVCRLVDMIIGKPVVANFAKHFIQQISPGATMFLEYLRELKSYLLFRMSISPRAQRATQKKLRKLWLSNEELKLEAAKLRNTANAVINETNTKLIEKHSSIKELEDSIANLHETYKHAQENSQDQSERNMITRWKDSQLKQHAFSKEVLDAQWSLKQNLTRHLEQEKELRAKKYKLESQMLGLIQKYDLAMTERQKDIDELKAEIADQEERLAKVKEEFDIQSEEYYLLMDEKACEERRIFQAKVHEFSLNHYARVIQRYWRAYRERKLQRLAQKKAKSKKKGKAGGKKGGGGTKGKKK
ncbi:dynein regulatory complex protein 10-like [Anabrus simplex]|uniref:dynein regulatory complex protein 10-like n=1 Tax=Anabrus simplex TaxID=316456 RepID=UPI0035A3AFD3